MLRDKPNDLSAEIEELRATIDGLRPLIADYAASARIAVADAKTEVDRFDLENRRLRAFIAKNDLPCLYCNLPKADMAKCAHGFPGCGRADDLVLDPNYDPGPIPDTTSNGDDDDFDFLAPDGRLKREG